MISVEIRPPEFDIAAHWDALAARAGGNVFMHPAALRAAALSGFSGIHMLLAWDRSADADTLVGFWALREKRAAPFVSYLAAPPYAYCFVSSPMVDPQFADAVMPAFLDAIEKDKTLPNVIQLKSLDGDGAAHPAMMRALGARHGQTLMLSERERPFLAGESDRKRSGSTGKKLRQDWNKLCTLGTVQIVNDRTPPGARDAFEVFLGMEDKSWKGANGTSLLSDDDDAAFARRLIGDLASQRNASVALLRVDGRPIAAQVLLYSGTMAYTWKIAFDAEFSKYSPGALLIDKVSDELFASGIATIESCSADGSFMAQLWTGKRMTVDMLVDVGARKSAGFALAALGERLYAGLREARSRLRALPWPALPKRKPLAATPTRG
jgi:CelD/BcsL family acetyltransferase involved in cellulose biosynthesis